MENYNRIEGSSRIAKLYNERMAKEEARKAADNRKLGPGGAPTRCTILPEGAEERKKYPVASGVLDYFPDAIAAISYLSYKGNEQHNPGQSLRWTRSKSGDEADTMLRHFLQRGTVDTDGVRHSVKMAWRALALLQKELEEPEQAQPAYTYQVGDPCPHNPEAREGFDCGICNRKRPIKPGEVRPVDPYVGQYWNGRVWYGKVFGWQPASKEDLRVLRQAGLNVEQP